MEKNILENIKNGIEVRENLIRLKEELKEEGKRRAFLDSLKQDFKVWYQLLENEDAKVRKNAALIMGRLGVPVFLEKIMEAYKKEKTLFVKSAYLTGMSYMDYRPVLSQLKTRLLEVQKIIPEDTDKKHLDEERRLLSQLISKIEGIQPHVFTGVHIPSKIILLTNRNYQEVTREQIKPFPSKSFNAGVMADVKDLETILPVRTYQEVLFQLDQLKVCENDPINAAKALASSDLMEFLKKRHQGEPPFYFRIELKSKMDLGKKSNFTKKMAGELERLSNQQLINSTSHYEIELRLIENKEGSLNVLMKLLTMKDDRFSYRNFSVAASIQPVNAALAAALAKDYLAQDGIVLDPFCGVGTMLIERHKLVKAKSMYGLDTYEKAILGARENTKAADMIINYINRDFFDFKHEYLFDEIFTNMPFISGHKKETEVIELYERFFIKAKQHLNETAHVILYSHNRDLIIKYAGKYGYTKKREFEISKKEEVYLFVLSVS